MQYLFAEVKTPEFDATIKKEELKQQTLGQSPNGSGSSTELTLKSSSEGKTSVPGTYFHILNVIFFTGKRKVEDFDFGAVLGEGAFGEVLLHSLLLILQVKLATEIKTGQKFAVKMLSKTHIISSGKKKYAHTERDVYNALNHPNAVKLFYTFQDKDYLCILSFIILFVFLNFQIMYLSCVPTETFHLI